MAEQAFQQIPAAHIEGIEIMLRADGDGGASHELRDWCHVGQIGYSVGYDRSEITDAAISRSR